MPKVRTGLPPNGTTNMQCGKKRVIPRLERTAATLPKEKRAPERLGALQAAKTEPKPRHAKMNNGAGLFDPGGPATVARAKRMCNSLGRSRSFSKRECASSSRIFVEKCYFSKKECASISRIFVEEC